MLQPTHGAKSQITLGVFIWKGVELPYPGELLLARFAKCFPAFRIKISSCLCCCARVCACVRACARACARACVPSRPRGSCVLTRARASAYVRTGGRLAGEIVLLFAHAIVEGCRLLLGSKGNKTEHRVLVILFMILSVPSVLVNVFYMELQTYVLRLDLILNIVCLAFIGLEIVVGILAVINFP
eukprot:Tamp_12147.p1 GENE.Tamp_12147~~Tamp_12147.p1  ORF type:complete len:185 (+),score=13.65 Tamp_12147:326-880(+)